MKMTPILSDIKEQLVKWTDERDDIRLVIVVRSRTRPAHPSSKLSDVDLLKIKIGLGILVRFCCTGNKALDRFRTLN